MSPLEEKVDHLIHLVEEQAFELQTVKQIVFELLNEDEKSYNDKERVSFLEIAERKRS
jgi:hypothetical protein